MPATTVVGPAASYAGEYNSWASCFHIFEAAGVDETKMPS